MSHDSPSASIPSRDSTTDIQDQRSESSHPSEGPDGHSRHSADNVRSEPPTSSSISSTNSDSPFIPIPSSASSDSVQAVNNSTQQSHVFMSHDSNISSITTASSSSVSISSRSANVSGTTICTSRSSQSIVTPVSSPSVIIHSSASHSPPPQVNPPLSPLPVNVHSGESIYRTIMNRLSALEANTTLRARYVEEQTSAMREMLRRLSEDVGRLEGIGRAQAQMYARSINDFEKHRREMDIEQRTLISQVNYLAEEVSPFIVYCLTLSSHLRGPHYIDRYGETSGHSTAVPPTRSARLPQRHARLARRVSHTPLQQRQQRSRHFPCLGSTQPETAQ